MQQQNGNIMLRRWTHSTRAVILLSSLVLRFLGVGKAATATAVRLLSDSTHLAIALPREQKNQKKNTRRIYQSPVGRRCRCIHWSVFSKAHELANYFLFCHSSYPTRFFILFLFYYYLLVKENHDGNDDGDNNDNNLHYNICWSSVWVTDRVRCFAMSMRRNATDPLYQFNSEQAT